MGAAGEVGEEQGDGVDDNKDDKLETYAARSCVCFFFLGEGDKGALESSYSPIFGG